MDPNTAPILSAAKSEAFFAGSIPLYPPEADTQADGFAGVAPSPTPFECSGPLDGDEPSIIRGRSYVAGAVPDPLRPAVDGPEPFDANLSEFSLELAPLDVLALRNALERQAREDAVHELAVFARTWAVSRIAQPRGRKVCLECGAEGDGNCRSDCGARRLLDLTTRLAEADALLRLAAAEGGAI